MKNEAVFPRFSITTEPGLGSTIYVNHDGILHLASGLYKLGFNRFMFVTAVDFPDFFRLLYRVCQSDFPKSSLNIKTELPKDTSVIHSVTSIWPGANWHERETFDLLGIVFKGHPDLKRIFMPQDWEGHPLRKDYVHERLVKRPNYI